jgi:hypothetical protein
MLVVNLDLRKSHKIITISLIQKLQTGGHAVTERAVICEEFPTLAVAAACQRTPQQQLEAPVQQTGSFFDAEQQPKAVDLLRMSLDKNWRFSFVPEPSYEEYLRMDKRLVNQSGVPRLLEIYDAMKDQSMPRYLSVAGSAAAEASLMATHLSKQKRLELLDKAETCWSDALVNSRKIEEASGGVLAEASQPLRLALRIATAPLLEAVIRGQVTDATLRQVHHDCLEIAEYNQQLRDEARRRGDRTAANDYYGFGHEINILLVVNRDFSPTQFALPSFTRSDTGYYLQGQTHDLSVIHQRWGKISNVTPVEVKNKKRSCDRRRYDALIIDNHDLCRGQLNVREVLQVLASAYREPSNIESVHAANIMTAQVNNMLLSYSSGRVLQQGEGMSVTKFRDAGQIKSHHPGFIPKMVSNIRLLAQS